MSDGKVFTDATDALLKDWAGDAIKPKVPFMLRGLVKPVIGIVISLINKHGDKIVPDKADTYINLAIKYTNQGNYDMAGKAVGNGIEALVSAKTSQAKNKFFVNIGEMLMSGLEWAIEEKKKEAV